MSRLSSFFVAAVLFTIICAASPAPKAELPELDGVRIIFSHLGSSPDLGKLRMAETGERVYSKRPGEDHWLRLENYSAFPISFPTQSMYMPRPAELAPTGPGSSKFALAEDSEVAVQFDSSEGRYHFGTMSSIAYLPAGRTILFSVPKRFLIKGRSISVEITAYTPEVVAGSDKPKVFAVRYTAADS